MIIGDIVEATVQRVVRFGIVASAEGGEIIIMLPDAARDHESLVQHYSIGQTIRVELTHADVDSFQFRGVPI